MAKYEVRQVYKMEAVVEAKDRKELNKKIKLLGGKVEELRERREIRVVK